MKGEVRGKTVTVYADGKRVYTRGLFTDTERVEEGRGVGVVVHNGYDNTVIYRRFTLNNTR